MHGCVGVNNKGCSKVWGPGDVGNTCQLCGGARYDVKDKPKEFIIHFPLKNRLQSLLQCEQYYKAVRWECDRTSVNEDYVSGLLNI